MDSGGFTFWDRPNGSCVFCGREDKDKARKMLASRPGGMVNQGGEKDGHLFLEWCCPTLNIPTGCHMHIISISISIPISLYMYIYIYIIHRQPARQVDK